jgi:manganese efflux pump family protein
MDFVFFLNSVFLGVGLAMDAFSVSIANALNEPNMRKRKMCGIAGTYGFYQFAMPMVGWICVRTIAEIFTSFQKCIPWIALILLLYIGGKMIIECTRESKSHNNSNDNKPCKKAVLTFDILMIQGIATSIDALSVGFTIAEYNTSAALVASLIIAVVTFIICMIGLLIGKKVGKKLSGKAEVFGGIILIAIGIEIFVKGIFC